ncbi:MAG: hypothetical protein ABIY39_09820 [Sphingomonas sp.]
MAHRQAEPAEQEPLKRACVYVEAAAACLLIVLALFALRGF